MAVNVSRGAAGCSFHTLTADLSAPFALKIILITATRHLVQSRTCYSALPWCYLITRSYSVKFTVNSGSGCKRGRESDMMSASRRQLNYAKAAL